MAFDPSSAKPLKNGFNPSSAKPVKAAAEKSYITDIGGTIGGAIKQYGENLNKRMNAPLPANPIQGIAEGFTDSLQQGGDALNVLLSPIAGVQHALLRPVSEGIANAGMGPPKKKVGGGFMGYGAQYVDASPEEQAQMIEQDLGMALSGAMPAKGLKFPVSAPPKVAKAAVVKLTPAQIAERKAAELFMKDNAAALKSAKKSGPPRKSSQPQMAAEVMGQGARNRLEAAANLNPEVAQILRNELESRVAQSPTAAMGAYQNTMRIDPAMAAGGVRETAEQMRARANPVYNDLFAQAGPQSSPVLDELLTANPFARDALKEGVRQMQGQGVKPFASVDVPDLPEGLTAGAPRDAGAYLADVRELLGGGVKKAARSDGPTLNEFVAARGGIIDRGGDLRSMGAGDVTLNRGRGMGKLTRATGQSLDDVARQAQEAGYFRDIPTERELLDAINSGLSGRPIRSMAAASGGADRAEYLSQLEQRLGTLNIPDRATPQQIAAALAADDAELASLSQLAETGGVYPGTIGGTKTVQAPTLQLLDAAKRNLDDIERRIIESPNANKNDLIAVDTTRRELVRQMDEINKGLEVTDPVTGEMRNYAGAREIGGEAPRLEAAARAARQKVFGQGSNSDFAQWAESLSAPELNGALAMIGDDLATATGGRISGALEGNVNLGKYLTRNAQQRLLMLGQRAGRADQVQSFLTQIADVERARVSAMSLMPNTNSKTSRLLEGANSINADLGTLTELPTDKAGLLKAIIGPQRVARWEEAALRRANKAILGTDAEDVISAYADLAMGDYNASLAAAQLRLDRSKQLAQGIRLGAYVPRVTPAAYPMISLPQAQQSLSLPAYATGAIAEEGQPQ